MKIKLKKEFLDYPQSYFDTVLDVVYFYLMPSGEFTFGILVDCNIIYLGIKHFDIVNNEFDKSWKIRFPNENEIDYKNFRLIVGPDLVIPNGNLYEISSI